ncbi:3-oxoacyl-ACP reductase [Actinoplanes ianthinogenes]|uniref:3-oxoacyl-ACP reductase n=1 Tax=Actinoplanes ianthinogenes TaxID=122358 RepID=A0ABM7MA10_9ACTN|nr:SDR family oxidoreductase [Actinoplanes ianthinogenes]BCJ48490.1 3-oxoacyl-ACP reductase [Actinoplanes ianthinogenes]GGR37022.1 3-oxoacyl-ACP reductase [Actinoplanes ianthinogenes]
MADTAIVTGGGAGLGREIALGLARGGYGVVVADIDEQAARACANVVEAHGVPARALRANVRERHDMDRIVAAAQALGGPHVLVNNAGGWTPRRQYPEATASEWAATIDLNLVAPMMLSQLVLDPMRAQGRGAIVNISSSGGVGFQSYGSPEYGAAKAGLIRFTSTLGGLAGTDGIRVMCVAPDWIGLSRAHDQWQRMGAAERAASRPLIPPAEVVAVVLDLVQRGTGGTVVEMPGGDRPRRLPGEPDEAQAQDASGVP